LAVKKKVFKKAIRAPQFLNEPIEYGKSFSRGIAVSLGETSILFISGTASVDHRGKTVHVGNFQAQTKRTFENILALLKSEGATWHDVIHTRCYLRDMRDYQSLNEFRNAFYKKHSVVPFPASVCVQAVLCRKELLVEIEVVAMQRRKKKPE
jgi:enamine deaminase RidA (YjgF/YER057c/UK114 family)